jgi:hypothetical protein
MRITFGIIGKSRIPAYCLICQAFSWDFGRFKDVLAAFWVHVEFLGHFFELYLRVSGKQFSIIGNNWAEFEHDRLNMSNKAHGIHLGLPSSCSTITCSSSASPVSAVPPASLLARPISSFRFSSSADT